MKHAILISVLFAVMAIAKPAPLFSGEKLGGGKLSLKESLKPGRYTLLSFWATWCTGCIEELRTVSKMLKTQPALPLDLLTVNVDLAETSSDVKPTMKLFSFSFPVVKDPKHEIFSKYQLDKSLPFSTLISPDGEMLKSFQGYSETLFQEVEKLSTSNPTAQVTH